MQSWICRPVAWTAGAVLTLTTAGSAAAAAAGADARAPPSPKAECLQAAAPCAPPAVGPLKPAGKIDPDGLLLFSVTLDQLTLTDGLAAYGQPEDPLIPMGELGRLLEYDIQVEPSRGRIIGHLGEARTSLVVDLATGTARVGARTVPLTPADVAVTETEIYLRASAIERLLPIKLKVKPQDLSMAVVPSQMLPVQSRLQRLARDRRASELAGIKPQDDLLKLKSPYRLFSMPAFDVAVKTGYQTGLLPTLPFTYDIRAGADLLYGNFQGYLGSNESGRPTVARILFERRSVEGDLLGPLHARVVSIGDVFTPAWSLGPRSIGGRGFAISTVPLDQTNIFNRVDLRGELPLGYDVELYINDILQSGENTPNKGRYEFLNVPLSRGVNVIRIVTYGPHGERSEETRIVNVGGGQLQKGELQFQLGVEQQELSVVNLTDPNSTTFISRGQGGLRAVATADYGLTSLVTLSGGVALIPVTSSDSRLLVTLGERSSLFGFLTQLDVAADNKGGAAAGVGLAGQLFGVSTVLHHVQLFGGFLDENGPGDNFTRPLRSRTELSFDGNASLKGTVIPLSFRVQQAHYADGGTDVSTSIRGSATKGPILYSTGFDYTASYGTSNTQTLSGFFAGSTYRNYTWQLRSTLDYDILPSFRPRALAITADHDINRNLSMRLGVGETLDDLQSFNLTASGVMRTKFGDFSLTGDYNNADHSWQLGAEMNFGLAYNPASHRYQVTRQGPGTGGSVLFHAFIDKNGNGRYDPGEPPVPQVIIQGGPTRAITGPDGRAFITGLGVSPTERLTVDLERVDIGSVKSPPSMLQFSPRAGQTLTIDYPIQPTSEVIVRILLRQPDGRFVGLSAVELRLVGPDNRIFEAKTEFDGSANFEGLTAGVYKLELDPDQAARLRMHLVNPLTINIKGDGGFTPDAKAEVKFDPRPEDASKGS